MSTYVMSDIHGCYDEFLSMLNKIEFSDKDNLIIAGDYIDRGKQSFEMLKWIEKCPKNTILLRGNHEEKFSEYVELMLMIDRDMKLGSDLSLNIDAKSLYQSTNYFIRTKSLPHMRFDLYGTINELLEHHNVALKDLMKWSYLFQAMPYYKKIDVDKKTYVIVHAGYTENFDNINSKFSNVEDFYLYAREEGYLKGGISHGVIIAGHTPVIAEGQFAYTGGGVFKHYNPVNDCTFYDIDCGCVFRNINENSRLACIRIEDEEIFYI